MVGREGHEPAAEGRRRAEARDLGRAEGWGRGESADGSGNGGEGWAQRGGGPRTVSQRGSGRARGAVTGAVAEKSNGGDCGGGPGGWQQ